MKTGYLALAMILAALPAAAIAVPTGNASDGLKALRELNLFVGGDASSQSEVEGKSYIGGTLSGGSSNYGVGSSNGQAAAASTRKTLTVGGNVTGNTINVNSGPGIAVGGSVASVDLNFSGATAVVGGNLGRTHTQGGGSIVQVGGNARDIDIRAGDKLDVLGNLTNFSAAGGATVRVGGSISGNQNANGAAVASNQGSGFVTVPQTASYAAVTAHMVADYSALSTQLSGFAADSTINVADPNNVKFVSTGGSDKVAVFTITDAASFFSSNVSRAFSFDVGAADAVIVNVRSIGALSSLTIGQNFLGQDNAYSQKLIWNIDPNIAMLNVTGKFVGSLLAVRSNLRNSNFIQGAVVVAGLDQRGEVHLGTYAGLDVSTVPEPALWAQLIAGFGFAGGMMRRRRNLLAA